MDNSNPFPGAAELAYKPKKNKKSRKQRKREEKERKKLEQQNVGFINGVKCTCGAWEQFYCLVPYIHKDTCSINKKGK